MTRPTIHPTHTEAVADAAASSMRRDDVMKVIRTVLDAWASTREVMSLIAANQDRAMCFVCQERPWAKKAPGLNVGICRPCELEDDWS